MALVCKVCQQPGCHGYMIHSIVGCSEEDRSIILAFLFGVKVPQVTAHINIECRGVGLHELVKIVACATQISINITIRSYFADFSPRFFSDKPLYFVDFVHNQPKVVVLSFIELAV